MKELIIFLIIIFFLLAVYFAFFYKFKTKKKLDKKIFKIYQSRLANISKNPNLKEKIIDYDKLYHSILLEIWYKWTFWEILKTKPDIIENIDEIWKLHKLRNKLTHDFDLIEEKILLKSSNDYKKNIEHILRLIS